MTLEGAQNLETSLVGSGGLKEVRAGLVWESVTRVVLTQNSRVNP